MTKQDYGYIQSLMCCLCFCITWVLVIPNVIIVRSGRQGTGCREGAQAGGRAGGRAGGQTCERVGECGHACGCVVDWAGSKQD